MPCTEIDPSTRGNGRVTNVAIRLGQRMLVAAQIGSYHSQSEQPAKAAVKATYEAYLRAWKDKDLNALDHILSDDYQAVNFRGIVSSKANEIATAKEDRTYNSLTADVISVALLGDCAIASGLNRGELEGRAR